MLLSLVFAEVLLAALGYRFSPIAFRRPTDAGDWRAFHIGARDPRLPGHDPLTVFDPFLLWRLNHRASPEITRLGFRGQDPVDKEPGEFVIVALGDSNTLGRLDNADHWPGFLQDLVGMNRSDWRVRVVNAGVYGYTSLQGLRRLEQVLAFGPDLVYFSFGANDANRVRTPDATYARRARWLQGLDGLRLAAPLAHAVWRVLDAGGPGADLRNRVSLPEYRANLQAFVARTRGAGAIPVLLTRPRVGASRDPREWLTYAPAYDEVVRRVAATTGATCVDAEAEFRGARGLFSDESHFNRRGHQRMARLVLKHLASLGVVATDFAYRRELDLGDAPDWEPSLGEGFWAAEPWGESRGRWTKGDAVVALERRDRERGLLIELSFQRPDGLTSGRIEVNGRTLRRFSEPNGRRRWRLELSDIPDRVLEVRVVVDHPFVPALDDPLVGDRRALGAFVHWVGLTQAASPLPSPDAGFLCDSAIYAGELDDERPELASGFWQREAWPDGSGRWTGAEATALLERRAREGSLELDLSLSNPGGFTRARVEVNHARFDLAGPNGRSLRWLDVRNVPGRRLAVRFVVDTAFVPRDRQPGSRDGRTLGVFVRSLRLAGAPDLP